MARARGEAAPVRGRKSRLTGAHDTSAANEPYKAAGCGVCGPGDVQYVLETDVGVHAATVVEGNSFTPIPRITFASATSSAHLP
jgi:hypothetical protein